MSSALRALLPAFLRRREPPASRLELVIAGEARAVTLKRSARAKRFTLRVKAGRITLTAPAWAKLGDARAFLARHADWVAERLARAAERVPFAPGALVPLRGVPHRVMHRPDARRIVVVDGDRGPELHVAGRAEHMERRLVDWLKAEARRDLGLAVARYTAKLGRPAKRIVVRDQTTRWGSCSAAGALSFSWRLVLAPPFILDYLAAHEVAHLAEMNHGPRFWALLRELYPETDRAKAWMRANGPSLHALGPAAGQAPEADAV